MPINRTIDDMNKDSFRYLIQNTDLTYFAPGGIAKALVESTNLEISRLQSFMLSNLNNSFISTAVGIYLDLFGEMLGIPRLRERRSFVSAADKIIRFYVNSGTLGSKLAIASNPTQALIPANTTVQNSDGSVVYVVSENVVFPVSARQIYVPAISQESGQSFNIGANQLNAHSLSDKTILVTNDSTILNGGDLESDQEYRARLSGAMTAKFGANATAVQLAATAQPGVSEVQILEFSRGAGTFDVLLVPQGNRMSQATIDATKRAIDRITAFGISSRVKEPEYVPIKIAIQLLFKPATLEGVKTRAKESAQQAVLNYLANIALGGELVINQLRSAVLNSDSKIKDLQILELCIDGHPRVLRNIKLRQDELFIPDETTESVQII